MQKEREPSLRSKRSRLSKQAKPKGKTDAKSQIARLVGDIRPPSKTAPDPKVVNEPGKETKEKLGKVEFPDFMKPLPPAPSAEQLGISILTPAKNIWVEHTINHVGNSPPSPYEYDISYSVDNRFLIAVPIFETVSFVAEPQRRSGVGFLRTNLVLPLEFSCLNAFAETVCSFTFTNKSQHKKSCIQPRTTEFRMNVLVQKKHMGRVVQQKKTIMVYDANDKEIIEILSVPTTTGWCCTPTPKQFSCPVVLRDTEGRPVIIGFMGRNGPDRLQCKFGKPLGFFFTTGEGEDFPLPDDLQIRERGRKTLQNLHKVFLLGAIIGMMTKYVSLKC